jgi:hypothetical protein
MSKFTKDMSKAAVQFGVGVGLVKFSQNVKKLQAEEKAAREQRPLTQVGAKSPKSDNEYKFIFRESAVAQMNHVLMELMDTINRNNIWVDHNVLKLADDMIEYTTYAINMTDEEKDNFGRGA